MFFCPNCSYLLDLRKGSYVPTKGNVKKEIKSKSTVKSVSSAIDKIINKDVPVEEIKPTFSKEQLEKNKAFGKLTTSEKKKMLELFEQTGGATGARFVCNNCAWNKEITSTIKLYTYSHDSHDLTKVLPSEYLLLTMNPIFSRTRDYTCKNKDCPTHKKDAKLEDKEAVFYRENDKLQVKYICGKCYNSWLV